MNIALSVAILAAPVQDKARAKKRMEQLLEKLNANELGPWEREDSHVVTEAAADAYKIVRADGEIAFAPKLPQAPDGIAKLYVRQNPPGLALSIIDGKRQFVWIRLYWGRDRKWAQTHANLSALNYENSMIGHILTAANDTIDVNASIAVPGILHRLRQMRKSAAEEREQELARLQENIRKLGEPWDGTNLLKEIYDIEVRLIDAPMDEQIELAKKRRELVKQIPGRIAGKP